MSKLRVFTFSEDWGLPTTGPFALKLLSWLNLARIPYQQVFENRSDKGPSGKSPWIEYEGQRIGDSQRIIQFLDQHYKIDLDQGLTAEQQAQSVLWRRCFEEGFHQVLEWELFVHPAGKTYILQVVAESLPSVVSKLIYFKLCRHFETQLQARGLGRYSPAEIERIGRADLEALSILLADRRFLVDDQPRLVDLAVFGQVAPMLCWPMKTPVAGYAKTLPRVRTWVENMRTVCFSETAVLHSSDTPGQQSAAQS
ncbi:MAG: glutathione S-transferase family protein [Saccharospirillum sp.]